MPAPPVSPLRKRITDTFAHDLDWPLDEDVFDQLARAVFDYQFRHNAPYAAYCERRGLNPQTVTHWTEIPPVPAAAFKEVPLIAGGPSAASLIFRTSGTTRGTERRGAHYIADSSLCAAALLPMFVGYLLPDAAQPAFVSLIPQASQVRDSSLSFMVTSATTQLDSIDGGCFMDARDGLREAALEETLDEFILNNIPVLLLGTSFAFVHWLDSLSARGQRLALPEGSRLMDTGGYKGRARAVPEAELRSAYAERLGLPGYMCINEYGMTELCSQFYDTTLRDRVLVRDAHDPRIKRPAPWVRTRVVDPETLLPVPEGQTGILQHFDLANLFSVLAVQTEDLGRSHEQGFEMLGRVPGAVPRGCSIALDLLLEAVSSRP